MLLDLSIDSTMTLVLSASPTMQLRLEAVDEAGRSTGLRPPLDLGFGFSTHRFDFKSTLVDTDYDGIGDLDDGPSSPFRVSVCASVLS